MWSDMPMHMQKFGGIFVQGDLEGFYRYTREDKRYCCCISAGATFLVLVLKHALLDRHHLMISKREHSSPVRLSPRQFLARILESHSFVDKHLHDASLISRVSSHTYVSLLFQDPVSVISVQ